MGRQKLRGIALLVHRSQLAPTRPVAQRGVGLDREAVEREMLRLQSERPVQICLPSPLAKSPGKPKIRSRERS